MPTLGGVDLKINPSRAVNTGMEEIVAICVLVCYKQFQMAFPKGNWEGIEIVYRFYLSLLALSETKVPKANGIDLRVRTSIAIRKGSCYETKAHHCHLYLCATRALCFVASQ